LSSITPIKTLLITGITLTPLGFWPEDEGTYYGEDQWWAGGPAPQPVTWTLEGTIVQQDHSSFSTPQIYIYNALDIRVGDWYVEASTSKALMITSIDVSATNEGYIKCTIEDIDRFEQFSAPDGVTATGADGFIISLSDDGSPLFADLTEYQSFISVNPGFIEDVNSRFQARNLKTEYVRIYQPGHGFSIGDTIILQNDSTFALADASTIDGERVIGTVTDVNIPGTYWFDYEPRGQLQENLQLPLPGLPGDVVWLDPANPGLLTATKPNSLAIPLWIKIDDTTGVRLFNGPVGPYNNYDSTRDPTQTDDSTQGYQPGSEWINTVDLTVWVLLDATPNGAQWVSLSTVQGYTGPTGPIGPTGPTGAPQTGAYQKYEFISQDRQTLFVAGHVPGFADVYYDGVRLTPDQFDDSNASYIVLNNPSIAGDPVEIIAWQIADISQLTGPTGSAGPTGPAATGAYVRHEFIATEGQTVFTVPYYVGFIDVYYDGTLLQTDQYTATDGNTVVLNDPSISGDPIVIISWEIATVSQLTGPTGITGPTGYTGPTGSLGPTGPAATGAYQRYDFTATPDQTVFYVNYYPGFLEVYYNGTLLTEDRYTATNGTTVTLTNNAIGGDLLVMIAWEIANVSQLTGPTGPAATGAYVRYDFTATTGQTIFRVPYNIGYIDVYYDGTLLSSDQYTATDGNTVTLNNPSISGDQVIIISWEIATVSQLTGPTGYSGPTGPTGVTGPAGVSTTAFFNTIGDRDSYSPTLGEFGYVLDDGTGNSSLYVVAQLTPNIIWVPVSISQGSKRYLSTLGAVVNYNDINPVIVGALLADSTILDVDVCIVTAFNDPGSIMTIGTDAITDQFMTSNMLDPTTVGTYINAEQQYLSSLTIIKAFFTPGFSGQGMARVIVTYQ